MAHQEPTSDLTRLVVRSTDKKDQGVKLVGVYDGKVKNYVATIRCNVGGSLRGNVDDDGVVTNVEVMSINLVSEASNETNKSQRGMVSSIFHVDDLGMVNPESDS